MAADLLSRLAIVHGLSELHLANDPGELVATVASDRTYFDIVAFEEDVEARLGWRPPNRPLVRSRRAARTAADRS